MLTCAAMKLIFDRDQCLDLAKMLKMLTLHMIILTKVGHDWAKMPTALRRLRTEASL
jgi:hypothetical protein